MPICEGARHAPGDSAKLWPQHPHRTAPHRSASQPAHPNPVIAQVFAGITLALCAALFVRLLIGERRRSRLDAVLRRAARALRHRLLAMWYWRARREASKRAAEEAIRRAKGGTWEGNVYKPRSFRKPPRDEMH